MQLGKMQTDHDLSPLVVHYSKALLPDDVVVLFCLCTGHAAKPFQISISLCLEHTM